MAFWKPDKIAHYEFCFRWTRKAPPVLRPAWGIIVFLAVSIGKELIWDLILKRGTPEWEDVWANWLGSIDGMRFY